MEDPETGRVVVDFREWTQVRPSFESHMWAAIQRMIGHLFELGNKPVSLSRTPGALERKRQSYVLALRQMGLPTDGEEAGQFSERAPAICAVPVMPEGAQMMADD